MLPVENVEIWLLKSISEIWRAKIIGDMSVVC